MAEVTIANRRDTVWGDNRVARADLSSIDNNDTWTTGLQAIENVIIAPTAAAATTQIGCTVSGGTITFKVESGSLAAMVTAIGS